MISILKNQRLRLLVELTTFICQILLRLVVANNIYMSDPPATSGGANDIQHPAAPKVAGGVNDIYLQDNTPV